MPGDCEAGSLLLPRWGGGGGNTGAQENSLSWRPPLPCRPQSCSSFTFLEGTPRMHPGKKGGKVNRESLVGEDGSEI